jgi:predicted nucleotidyltransferase
MNDRIIEGRIPMVDETIITQSAQAILAACPPGSRVILFGSRARGDARESSDVDFMVVEPTVPSRLAEAARLARVVRPFRIPCDIVVVSEQTFESCKATPNSVCFEAARDGRVFA